MPSLWPQNMRPIKTRGNVLFMKLKTGANTMTEQQLLIIADKLSKAMAGETPLSDAIIELANSIKDIADAIHRFTDKINDLKYNI